MTGWWYTYPSEKYEFVSWEYYSQYMEKMEKYNMFQTTNQVTITNYLKISQLNPTHWGVVRTGMWY
jgi:hypothetical protein